jgi:hypothetical protein
MQKSEVDRVVTQLRAATEIYQSACRERNEAVLKLAKVDGLSVAEIARVVTLAPPSVARILKKGR